MSTSLIFNAISMHSNANYRNTMSLLSLLAVSSSRPLPVSSSGVLVVLIKYFNIISQEMHELFVSISSS